MQLLFTWRFIHIQYLLSFDLFAQTGKYNSNTAAPAENTEVNNQPIQNNEFTSFEEAPSTGSYGE